MPITSEYHPVGPAAFSAPDKPSAAPVKVNVPARRLYSNPLDYRTGPDGRLVSDHPVNQGMALSMSVRKGSIRSAPNVGHELHKVEIGTERTAADVRDRVLVAYPLSRYVSEGSVEILSITHEEQDVGRLIVSVLFRNTKTNRAATARYGEKGSR